MRSAPGPRMLHLALASSLLITVAYGASARANEATTGTRSQEPPEGPDFAPVTNDLVANSRLRVINARQRLDALLRRSGSNGVGWRSYLDWPQLEAIEQSGDPQTLVGLRKVAERFRQNHVGLDLPAFLAVGNSLRDYLDVLQAEREPKLEDEFQKRVTTVRDGLPLVSTDPESRRKVGAALGWLDRHAQASAWTQQVRAGHSNPNFVLKIGAKLVAAAGKRPVDDIAPVRDFILGTRITGMGRTVGEVRMVPVPDARRAVVETIMTGINYSDTVGRQGPVRVYSDGTTRLLGITRLAIDDAGIHALPTNASARSSTKVHGVSTTAPCVLDGLVRRIAWKRIPRQKAATERIAGRHAAQRLTARIDQTASASVARANLFYRERLRGPLVRLREFPRRVRFASDAGGLSMTVTHDGPDRLAAPVTPPATEAESDLAVVLHESLIDSLGTGLLAGKTIRQVDVEEQARKMLGRVPEPLADKDERGPWSITFAQRDPLTVVFRENHLELTFRAQRYTTGDRRLDGMNVSLRYEIVSEEGLVKAVRQGEPEVLPPGYIPGSGERIPLRLTSLRNLLKRRFGKIFPEEVLARPIEFEDQLSRLPSLHTSRLTSADGWLSIAWRQTAAEGRLVRRPLAQAGP